MQRSSSMTNFTGIALVAAPLVALRVLAGLDEDALRRARRGAAQARDAAHAPVVARRQAVDAAEALGVRALLLGVRDRRDAVVEALEHRVRALAAHHLARVVEEVLHRDADAAEDLGQVALHLERRAGRT